MGSYTDMVGNYTNRKLKKIAAMTNDSAKKKMLAELRRGVGKQPGELPELWGMIFEDMPEELLGKYSEPSKAEWAVYISLTLYALHSQSSDTDMNVEKISVGAAAARIVDEKQDNMERIMNRMSRILNFNTIKDIERHLRSLTELMKNDGVGLDYEMLARDLFLLQSAEYSKSVKLKWGRDFYGYINAKGKEDK